MQSLKQDLQEIIFEAVKRSGFNEIKEDEIPLEAPPSFVGGDFASNVALVLGEKAKENPQEIAKKIAQFLNESKAAKRVIEKAEVAGGGFINVTLTSAYLVQQLARAMKGGEKFGKGDALKGKKIMVEFTDPNPFKEFHIGHLYSNAVGESIARLLESQGAEVKRASYQGDVGLHVAKALWGMEQKLKTVPLKALEKKTLNEKVKFLGEAYALGAKMFEEDSALKEEINELNKKIYELHPSIKKLYGRGRKWSLDYFETIYKRLGTKFDFSYFERDTGKEGLAYVKKFLAKHVFEKSKGAVIFNGEKYGLHTRVFINSQGLPTYEAKELALAFMKYQDFPCDESIIVTGSEINEYFKVVLTALEEINPQLRAKTKHISHGMVRLPEGKMSSRKGEVITGEWLVNEAKSRVLEIMNASKSETDAGQKEAIAETVAVGAVKYSLLKSSLGKDITFDFNESINLEGASGPYLQYTYVRTKSVLKKAKHITFSTIVEKSISLNRQERQVIKLLLQFSDVVRSAGFTHSPNVLCTFLFEAAKAYNNFYGKHRIIGSGNEALRLALTFTVSHALKNGLALLGIQVPEKM
ncbi:MAG: arginine--tRNA ligase [Candidatus Portnoybacteria bacterium]|nr:arginine--tRNA ligase [Candidatus Portnoybacteria bacterium]